MSFRLRDGFSYGFCLEPINAVGYTVLSIDKEIRCTKNIGRH